MQFVHQPAPSARLGDFLKSNFEKPWTSFRAAVAFVKRSGTRHIVAALSNFARTNHVNIIVGIDLRGTSQEGLQDLLDAVGTTGQVIVFHNRLPFTFHPKVYLFKSGHSAEILVGSGNLTEGGLFTNYEASLRLQLDLADPAQRAVLKSVDDVLDTWANPLNRTALPLDAALLAKLVALGLVPVEALSAPETVVEPFNRAAPTASGVDATEEPAESPFAAYPEPRAPTAPRPSRPGARPAESPVEAPPAIPATRVPAGPTGFVMTLQRTDVGVGQTTRGTSRRSPEIFIPVRAVKAQPTFWGWPDKFTETETKLDRKDVRVRMGAEIFLVNMMAWKRKTDLRLRSEKLRSAGSIGDIFRIERGSKSQDYDYRVEVIRQGTPDHAHFEGICIPLGGNSRKAIGYY